MVLRIAKSCTIFEELRTINSFKKCADHSPHNNQPIKLIKSVSNGTKQQKSVKVFQAAPINQPRKIAILNLFLYSAKRNRTVFFYRLQNYFFAFPLIFESNFSNQIASLKSKKKKKISTFVKAYFILITSFRSSSKILCCYRLMFACCSSILSFFFCPLRLLLLVFACSSSTICLSIFGDRQTRVEKVGRLICLNLLFLF